MTPKMQAALDVVAAWDLRCGVDSAGASIFHGWLAAFARITLRDESPLIESVLLKDLDYKVGLVMAKFLAHWLDETAPTIDAIDRGAPFPSKSGVNFWDDRATADVAETRDQAVLTALSEALVELEAIFAPLAGAGEDPSDPATWRWGRLAVTNAPSDRFVFEMLPDGVVGRAILPGGQDELPGSSFHNSQFEDFIAGRWRPLRYAREDVLAGQVESVAFEAGFGAAP